MIKVYTMKELKEILGLTEPSIRKLVKSGKLKKVETNGAFRVTEDSLNKFLKGE